jgi:hypothetical protein
MLPDHELAVGGVVAILSMCSVARAETSRPFLCWEIAEITGSSAIYDRPGGIEIGKLDPGTTYRMGEEAREIDREVWREVGRAEVSIGWVRRTDLTKLKAGVRCLLKEFFTERYPPLP